MTDTEFLEAFEHGRLTELHHRDHLRLTWLRVGQVGAGAEAVVAADIRRFASRVGAARKYHETLTTFWVRLVRHVDAFHCPASFDELLSACPLLLDQSAPSRHWLAQTLWSQAARSTWIEPDLLPIPTS